MVTLQEIQSSVGAQMQRDWKDKTAEAIASMCMCGLAEEAGEVVGLHKRHIRQRPSDALRCTREKYVEELGDVVWYVAALCNCLGIDMDELWRANEVKLEARYGK